MLGGRRWEFDNSPWTHLSLLLKHWAILSFADMAADVRHDLYSSMVSAPSAGRPLTRGGRGRDPYPLKIEVPFFFFSWTAPKDLPPQRSDRSL